LNAPANDDEHDGHKAANLSVKHFRSNKNNKFKPQISLDVFKRFSPFKIAFY